MKICNNISIVQALKILMDRGDKEVALDTLYVAINEKQLHTLS